MLTKEFAAKVGLSEKQVRKIVQHLEDRGYQLAKTEYRGREATDFHEDDIELFQEIAEKVKETNSYDQAFETLEQEKDFLQVLVKEESTQQSPELQQLIDELKVEVQHMRRERQMLGEMLQRVHIQQQKLEQTIALQAPQQDDSTSNTESTTSASNSESEPTTESEAPSTEVHSKSDSESSTITQQVKQDDISDTPSKVTVETKEEYKPVDTTTSEENSNAESESTPTSTSNNESLSTSESMHSEPNAPTSSETVATSNTEQSGEPKKKGFFQRLFNI